jgi:hypothetical protein
MTNEQGRENACCPKFDAGPWEGRMFDWNRKRFIKARAHTLFSMPLNLGRVMRNLSALVQSRGGTIPDRLCLSDHTSKWNMDVYVAVDREIPGAENIALSGKFFSKVYEGPFRDTGKWCDSFKEVAKGMKLEIKKWYMWYTTCPKCAKKYGKNYVAIVAEVQ